MTVDPHTCASCGKPLAEGVHFCPNCGTPTPTEPGVPERTMPTGVVEVSRVRSALADRYRIEGVLGEGGMATVYLAEDLRHSRKVAVKVMRPELAETLGAERFLREVAIAAKLSHPNILPVYDSGSVNGILYYVMPVVEGESLPARLKREKQLPVGEALRLAREVSEALTYAHERGIVHRDIKPANILINSGHALVADFGIARATGDEARALTKTGLAIGTPQYMSPEQASGDPNVDGRTDIYALGAVLYEMLAGEPPFTGPTAQAIITRSITEQPRALTSTRTTLAPAVNSTVMRALAKSPADRYSSASELTTALTTAEEMTRTGSGPTLAVPQRFRAWQYALGALVVIVIGALGWKAFAGGSGGAREVVRSVAVLPFVSQMSGDDAYYAEGIVDEVRDKLSGLDSLTVIASASADQYRNTDKPIPQIASELNVDQLLTGKVGWGPGADGGRELRVTTELVDGKSGDVTWRETFTADSAQAFQLQGRIATRVATALGTVLDRGDTARLSAPPTENAEAYALYLKAQAMQLSTPNDAISKAALLDQAVALDPNFARAWGALANSLTRAFGNGSRDPTVGRRAREATERTLALAPDSAGAHLVANYYFSAVTGGQDRARQEAAEALKLDPRNSLALTTAADYDRIDGDYKAMFDKLSLARKLDPRSKGVLTSLLRSQIFLGRVDEALATSDELVSQGPDGYAQMEWIGFAHLAAGDLDAARRQIAELAADATPTEMAAYFAGYQELAYLLPEKDQELLFRLTPASFDGDRAWWGQALATAAMQRGDTARARAFADSSLATAWEQITAAPDDPQLRILNAVMLSYLGRKSEALAQASEAMADTVGIQAQTGTYVILQYARVLLNTGERERALDVLEKLLGEQYYVTRGFLKTDPLFRSLDGNPRFERLKAGGIKQPVD